MARKIRPDMLLLLHLAVPAEVGLCTELSGGRTDPYALSCFRRWVSEMEALVSGGGFTDVGVRSLNGSIAVPWDDDITKQHLLTARRR